MSSTFYVVPAADAGDEGQVDCESLPKSTGKVASNTKHGVRTMNGEPSTAGERRGSGRVPQFLSNFIKKRKDKYAK